MPLIEMKTNMKGADIPAGFEARFNKHFSAQWGKDLNRMVFHLLLDQRMTVGDDTNPVILFRCWSFNVFDNLEVRNKSSIDIYKFLKAEFPALDYDRIRVALHDMPRVDIGPKPDQ